MSAIVLQCYNKPDTLALLLNSLMNCRGHNEFDLIVWQDNTAGNAKQKKHTKSQMATAALIESLMPQLIQQFRSVQYKANALNLGCYKTCRLAIDYAFQNHDFVVFTEDDAIFAEDALVWFDGMSRTEAFQHPACRAIAGESVYFNTDGLEVSRRFKLEMINGVNRTDAVSRFISFNWVPSTTFAVDRRKWAEIANVRGLDRGDVLLCELCAKEQLHCLFPVVPRVKDIGMLHVNGYSVGIHDAANVPPKNVYLLSDDVVEPYVEYRPFTGRQGPIYALTSKLLSEEGDFESLYNLEPET